MQLKNYLMILGALLLISGCSTTKPIEVIETKVSTPIIHPKLPPAVDPLDLKFKVVNEENLQTFLDEIQKEERAIVFIAMRVKDYEALSINVQDLNRYMKQQREIIVYYKNMTTETPAEEKQ